MCWSRLALRDTHGNYVHMQERFGGSSAIGYGKPAPGALLRVHCEASAASWTMAEEYGHLHRPATLTGCLRWACRKPQCMASSLSTALGIHSRIPIKWLVEQAQSSQSFGHVWSKDLNTQDHKNASHVQGLRTTSMDANSIKMICTQLCIISMIYIRYYL